MYSFRNALSHTFGLYHIDESGEVSPRFIYDQNAPTVLLGRRGPGWELNVDSLIELFLLTIGVYRDQLAVTADLQPAFLEAFQRYGLIYVKGGHVAPRASRAAG